MNVDKEKWLEGVFQSMQGSERAKPRKELFTIIKKQIADAKVNVVPMYHLRKYAAAAILILLVNSLALFYYSQTSELSNQNIAVIDTYNESIINSFQLYEI